MTLIGALFKEIDSIKLKVSNRPRANILWKSVDIVIFIRTKINDKDKYNS